MERYLSVLLGLDYNVDQLNFRTVLFSWCSKNRIDKTIIIAGYQFRAVVKTNILNADWTMIIIQRYQPRRKHVMEQ